MTLIRFFLVIVFGLTVSGFGVHPASAQEDLSRFRVGVAIGAEEGIRAKMEPFRRALEDIIDRPVDLYLIDTMGDVVEALSKGDIDYARLTPSAFAAADALCACVEPLVSARPDKNTDRFHAILVAPKKGELVTLDDLKGVNLGVENAKSIAGYRVPLANMKHEGVDPWSHFSALIQVADGVDGIRAVLDGRLGATLAWSTMSGDEKSGYSDGALREIYRANRRDLRKLFVVWQSQGIPYSAHSVRKDLPDDMKRALRAGLMELKSKSSRAYNAIEPDLPGGFIPVVDADYRAVMRTYDPDLQAVFGR